MFTRLETADAQHRNKHPYSGCILSSLFIVYIPNYENLSWNSAVNLVSGRKTL